MDWAISSTPMMADYASSDSSIRSSLGLIMDSKRCQGRDLSTFPLLGDADSGL